jgi:hypothetical protein
LLAIVQEAGIEPLRAPANDNLDWVRNLVRHRILPRLAQEAAQLEVLLAGVSAAARTALPVLERLGARQDLAPSPHTDIGRLSRRGCGRRDGRIPAAVRCENSPARWPSAAQRLAPALAAPS